MTRAIARGWALLGLTVGSLASPAADAADVHELTLQADVRAVVADTDLASFMERGMGLLRYDEAHDGLRLGSLMIDYAGPVSDTVRAAITLFANDDGDKNPVDLTEAFLEWRPVPMSEWRWRVRLGAFYPPVSFENRGIGWENVYGLSASAINTWVGEEVRTIGSEVNLTLAGAGAGRPFDVGAVFAVYGWNDPMGVVIQQRGWAIHDRQTALFGKLPAVDGPPNADHSYELFHEIDGKAGYYGGLEFSWLDRFTARVLHYDNHGDPAKANREEIAWLSRFDAFGFRWELPRNWTLIGQRMDGDTAAGASADGRGAGILDFWSDFLLVSKQFRTHRLSLRYDRFYTVTVRGAGYYDSWQDGHAWTLAYRNDFTDRWQLHAEYIDEDVVLRQRRLIGAEPGQRERLLQVALRYAFLL